MKITTAFLTSLLFLVVVPSSIALDAIKMNVLPNESGKLVEASQMLGLNLGKQVPEGVSLDFHFKYDRGESPEEVLIILSAMFLGGGREMVQGASPRMQIRYVSMSIMSIPADVSLQFMLDERATSRNFLSMAKWAPPYASGMMRVPTLLSGRST